MSPERQSSKFGALGGLTGETSFPWYEHAHLTEQRRNWVFAGLGLLVLALILWAVLGRGSPKPPLVPAIPVSVATAASEDIPVSITALGAAQAWTSVAVLAQVSGKLLSVDFTEGTEVRAGQILARIDPAPYAAALTQAEGALKRDQAALADARINLARYQALLAQNAISRQQADTQAALVQQDEGTVLIDQGSVAAARVNLDWCTIRSPVAGRAGVRNVDSGNLVSSGGSIGNTPGTAAATNSSSTSGSSSGTSIVTVNQIQPIAVTFTVPEGDFERLSSLSNGFRRPLLTKAYSQETNALLGTGELSIADNRIDPSTGSVELKARFENAGEQLWPGEFVNVQLTLQVLHHATTIPATAVNRGPNGEFAFVVDAKKRATLRPITVAWTQGSSAIIGAGLKPGEIVVTDGQMILRNGSTIRVIAASRRHA
jgi:multidrug efflux system membrane fusion protein